MVNLKKIQLFDVAMTLWGHYARLGTILVIYLLDLFICLLSGVSQTNTDNRNLLI